MRIKSYDEGFKDGFQHGFLISTAINQVVNASLQKTNAQETKKESYYRQKKAARDWAISMGYLKKDCFKNDLIQDKEVNQEIKIQAKHKLKETKKESYYRQKKAARDWAISMGYIKNK